MQSRRLCWFSALLVDAIESEDGNSSCWLLKDLHTISNQQFLANQQKSHTFLYQIFKIFLYNLHNLQTISHRSICTIASFFPYSYAVLYNFTLKYGLIFHEKTPIQNEGKQNCCRRQRKEAFHCSCQPAPYFTVFQPRFSSYSLQWAFYQQFSDQFFVP